MRETFWNLLMIFFIVSMIGSISSSNQIEPKQSALLLNITGTIVDKPVPENPLEIWFAEMMGEDTSIRRENSIFELVEKIKQAKSDTRITGLIISLSKFYGSNSANLQTLGAAIEDFKESKKPVIAFADSLTQQDYYLASFADEIHIAPYGSVDIHGFATSNLYFKSLLDTLGVNTHVFRVGTYKSAVEPYLRDDMSPEAREMTNRFLTGLWDNYLETVSNNRHFLKKEEFFTDSNSLITELKANNGNMAKLAYEKKWVDSLSDRSQIENTLDFKFGITDKENSSNYISIYDYTLNNTLETLASKPNIAVITIDGPIVDGFNGPGYAGADTISEQISEARRDPDIKGLILRVNSPGGSVTAAEVIHAELEAFKLAGKPIVASFGGLAASGGYWVATPANYIVANENTLTGSIGIFGVIPTIENSLAKVGVFSNSVATTEFGSGTVTEALPDALKQMIQLNIEYGYQRFIGLVSASRHMSFERVDAIAQGQVWIAKDALKHKLIDEIGNFDIALEKMKSLTEINQLTLKWYKKEPTFFESIMLQMNAAVDSKLSSYIPESLMPYVKSLSQYEALLSQTTPSVGGAKVFVLCETCSDNAF
ncbi:signal peptide peptidase SppA [Thorsellia anophelis]|nr:signal peptide peptidase SppA [Thorsellia anophelis]